MTHMTDLPMSPYMENWLSSSLGIQPKTQIQCFELDASCASLRHHQFPPALAARPLAALPAKPFERRRDAALFGRP